MRLKWICCCATKKKAFFQIKDILDLYAYADYLKKKKVWKVSDESVSEKEKFSIGLTVK